MVPKVFVRSSYNYDRDEASVDAGLHCDDESLAKQSFAEEVDINTIVKRFGVTGALPEDIPAPQYGDYDDVVDFHSAMNAVAHAREAFGALPGEVRYRFNNDPQRLLEFVADAGNYDEAEKLGLVVRPKAPPEVVPLAVRVVPPEGPVAAVRKPPEGLDQ